MNEAPEQVKLSARLASVQVGVRPELEISRLMLHGEAAYVVRDPITFKSHRLSPSDYQVFVALDANKSLGDTFNQLQAEGAVEDDQREDFYRFILNLSQIGLLSLPISDGSALYRRFQRRKQVERKAKLLGFLFLRVPLIQPDRFLDRTIRWVSPLFTRVGFVTWLICLALSLIVVCSRWQEFLNPIGTILTLQNLPTLWLLLVVLKVFHEFGHAYACKRFGGAVPEMGAYFIVFTPCAYIDASAAWGFPRRIHRVIVGLGGMYFESIAAMIAVLIWCLTSPGPVHSAAQYAIILASIVTIGFNVNPLMKYDGYYILSDLLGMPNLRSDSRRCVSAFAQRWLLGLKIDLPRFSRVGLVLIFLFGIASSLYKVIVVFGIAITIAFKIPAAGLAIALLYVGSSIRQYGTKLINKVAALDSAIARRRAMGAIGLSIGSLVSVLCFFPVSSSLEALGVVTRQEERIVHAGASGFLIHSEVADGTSVERGTVLCQLENIDVVTALERKEAEISQLRIQLQDELNSDVQTASAIAGTLEQALREQADLKAERDRLLVRAPIDGILIDTDRLDETGRFVHKGEPLASVSDGRWIVKVMVTAEHLSSTAPREGDTVSIRMIGQSKQLFRGKVLEVAKTGSKTIDQPALTHAGGGTIAVSTDNQEAEQPFFEISVMIDGVDATQFKYGMTALVQFEADRTPVGAFLYRRGLRILNQLRLAG